MAENDDAQVQVADEEERKDYTQAEREEMAKNGEALPDGSFPIANEADLRNAIQAMGRANNSAAAKAHIIKRAKALDLSSLLPDDWQKNGAGDEEQEHRENSPELEARLRKTEMLEGTREVRRFDAQSLEVRSTSDGMLRFSGYASVTETPYQVGDFEETIARGAFRRTLGEDPDVVLLVNHGEGGGLPLARTKSGTMTLREDSRGLRVDADLNPEDPDVKSLIPKLERGDVDEMSFAFRVTDQSWSEDRSKRLIRACTIHKGDCSIVTYGANDASTGGLVTLARSHDGEVELRAGKAISSANTEALTRVLDLISSADDAVDQAQPLLAGVLGVQNPDEDRSGEDDGDRAAESAPARVIVVPDHTSRARERLARLRRAA